MPPLQVCKDKGILGSSKLLPAPNVPLQITWDTMDLELPEPLRTVVYIDCRSSIMHTFAQEVHGFINPEIDDITK